MRAAAVSATEVLRSERDFIVQVLRCLLAAAAAPLLCRLAGALLLAAQHLQLAVVAAEDYLGGVLLGAALVHPLARLDLAAHGQQHALVNILVDDAGELAPHDDPVPFRALLGLAVLFPPLGGGNRQVRAPVAVLRRPDLRITADETDDHSFIPHRS